MWRQDDVHDDDDITELHRRCCTPCCSNIMNVCVCLQCTVYGDARGQYIKCDASHTILRARTRKNSSTICLCRCQSIFAPGFHVAASAHRSYYLVACLRFGLINVYDVFFCVCVHVLCLCVHFNSQCNVVLCEAALAPLCLLGRIAH